MSKVLKYFSTIDDGDLSFFTSSTKQIVKENRESLAIKLGYNNEDLVYMKQVHGNRVQIVDKNSPKLIEGVDGIVTNEKNLPLLVKVADCIPILFYDKKQEVVAAVHAGRNSTFLKIVEVTIDIMVENFNCEAKDIEVEFGASIQKCCYEVSEDIANIVIKNFGREFVYNRNIDLQGINKMLLEKKGVENIKISKTCTKCSNEPYYSHRKGDKQRFAGIISNIMKN